jgi:LysR family transcriptional regulator, transcriptional activator of nhaA
LNTLNYNHLLYFKTVVDQGSIAKASSLLRVGAPAISMQIKLLEDVLQKDLFDRKNRKMILTDTGKIVYEYAQSIFDLGNQLLTTLNDQVYGQIKIQIGAQDSVPKNLISRITSHIYQKYDAMVSIFNGNLEQMTFGLVHHDYDLIILNSPPSINDQSILFSKRIMKCPVVLAGSEKYLHLKNEPLKAYTRVPFILPTATSSLRHRFEHYCEKNHLRYHLAGEAQDTVVQKNMAISGNGIILIMKEAINSYVENRQLHILHELKDLTEELWLVSVKRQIQNPVAKELMENYKFN